jgi:acyl-CoA thioesterase FadM
VSFTFTQSANLKNDEKQVLCKGQVYCGCISLKRNAPAKIPEELRVKMKSLVQNND